jgi:hypothetical protein
MLSFNFTMPMLVGMFFALLAVVFHYMIVARLSRAGVKVKLVFLMPREQLRQYQMYRFMGSKQQWPMWPFYALCVSAACMAGAGIYVGLTLPK